jgi:lambda family phage portal protein
MTGKPRIRAMANVSDGFENPHGAFGNTSHDGASLTARDVASWRPMLRSADAEILPERGSLVARARDIDKNNPIARGVRQTLVDNVVGIGPRLLPEPDYAALGKAADWADAWAEDIEGKFCAWWWNTHCHAGDTLTGDQLAQQALAAQVMNGEAITLPLWLPERADGYSTKLQMVESDRLSNPNGMPDTQFLRGGIELDPYGMPLAYNIRTTHPGDFLVSGITGNWGVWERIPRRTDFGRLRVIHFFDAERSPQSRGKPLMTSILPQLKNLDRFTRAEIDAAVANALVTGIITTPLEHDEIVDLFSKDRAAYLKARNEHSVRLESSSIVPLFPGDDFKSFVPGRPNANFGTFAQNILRIVGVGVDLPYELLAKDWQNTTYTSGRMSLLEAWRSFNRRRDWISTGWLNPIYALWFEEQFHAGNIDAPGYDADLVKRTAYLRCSWIFPGRGWVDQVKEAQGASIRLDANLSTLAKECAEQGLYWRDVLRQRAVEYKFAESLGLPSVAPTALRATAAENPDTGAAPAAPGGGGSKPPPTDPTETDGTELPPGKATRGGFAQRPGASP